jgi:UDP-N-acetylmuramoyl-tripeptide--D-alanyl-D-alanine ligase
MDISALYQLYLTSRKVSTDTRQIEPDALFFALKGPSFNANAFAKDALAKGASYAIVDDANYATDERIILVDDCLTTLQDLARFHRRQLTIPVVGLTGSNGKTTSKELLNAVLRKKFKTFATKGNLNNHIGVPLSILAIDSSIELAIIEMGANHLSEIALLSSIALPTHGFITNIGKAHIGTFGGFENIIRGKSELYQHLIQTNGTVFINSQNPILLNMAKRFSKPVMYPAKGDYYSCELVEANPYLVIKTEEGAIIQTQMIGAYNFENIATALCIGKYFGVEAAKANEGIAEYMAGNMRSQVITKGTNTIILDAYNANPSSMAAAIENLAGMKAATKVAIVGDMFELEEEAEKEHRLMGELLAVQDFKKVYLCGLLMKSAAMAMPKALYFATRDELIAHLQQNPIENATILIKASRGMGLEKCVEIF